MPLRSRTISLAGRRVVTPLLIPSISSKGFAALQDGSSELDPLIPALLDHYGGPLLISAYDLHHGRFPETAAALGLSPDAAGHSERLVVIDSGGYETSQRWESGFTPKVDWSPSLFGSPEYRAVIGGLPRTAGTVIVSYDGADEPVGTYSEQLQVARTNNEHVEANLNVLLKPPQNTSHDFANGFEVTPTDAPQIIGVTETELGDTLLERATTLRQLRNALDTAHVNAPIHLFGCLDPLLMPIYYRYGAEIFDGLGWLRYAYRDGLSVHPDQGSALDGELTTSTDVRTARRALKNLRALTDIASQMRTIPLQSPEGSFSAFEQSAALSRIYDELTARMEI